MKPISKQWRNCSRACALLVLVTLVACQPIKTANSICIRANLLAPRLSQRYLMLKQFLSNARRGEARLRRRKNSSLSLSRGCKSKPESTGSGASSIFSEAGTSDQIEEALSRWQEIDPNSLGLHEATIIYAAEHDQRSTPIVTHQTG